MGTVNWEDLIGAVVDGRYCLRQLTYAGQDQAEFVADAIARKNGARPLVLTLLGAPAEEFDQLREQLSKVARLHHASVLMIDGAGAFQAPSGAQLLYLASEQPEETLLDRLRSGPLAEEAVLPILGDILDGLEYFHHGGLVYRSLEPQTIVRVGERWKLADLSRLHPAGEPDSQIGSYLNGSRYTPPEAYSGLVTPAWDAWGLGTLLLELLTGRPEEGVLPPPPFEAIVRGCLEGRPEARLKIAEIGAMLGPRKPAVVEPPPPAAAIVVESKASPLRAVAVKHWPLATGFALLAVLALSFVGLRRPAARKAPAPVRPQVQAAAPVKPAPAHPHPPAAPVKPRKSEVGLATFSSADMNGRRTASGERFDSTALTAAHRSYPLGSRVRITNLKNGRSAIVRINDRGVFHGRNVIRVTRRVAEQLAFTRTGSTTVRLELLDDSGVLARSRPPGRSQ